MTWNLVRALANVVAFALLTWALVLHGRADPASEADAIPPQPVNLSLHN